MFRSHAVDTLSVSRTALRLGCLAALLFAALPNQAQTRSLRAAPQPAAPTMAPGTAGFGTPSPSGLASPNPAQPASPVINPSGLPSPLPNPAGLPSVTVPNLSSPATPGNMVLDEATTPQPAVPGGTAYGGGAAAGARPRMAVAPGPLTPLQIAQSFIGADANRDGELTRAEALRLTIAPFSFEEMDLNHDGVLTRSEYEAAFAR